MNPTGATQATARRIRPLRRPARVARITGLVIIAMLSLLIWPSAAQATTYAPISGAGSTWDENAINQWTSSVSQYGMEVNYAGTGSSAGRLSFGGGLVDFGASDIPYGEKDDNIQDPQPPRNYAYMPVVAGGTSFMYNLQIGGRRVTNLRLSGETITKIFTGNLTMWNAPEIAAENPGLVLPARQIVPVVRTDGSGSTAQLTAWMAATYPNIWNPYCAAAGRFSTPCGTTSLYPVVAGSDFISQSLDSGVAGYVAQSTSDGAITYTEYSYALEANFPVVAMLNTAGYYDLPTADNVAVALNKAQIYNTPNDPDTNLTQNLLNVYTDPDPRAYPLSSYSYFLIPTSNQYGFNNAKGQTLSAFAYYVLCQGQQTMAPLGYSPLPINLVEAGFTQIKKIPGASVQNINVASCNNPTFSTNGTNTLADQAPQPPACAKAGPVQCVSYASESPVGTGGGGSGGSGGSTGTSTGATTGAGATTSSTASAAASSGAVNPDTGQVAGANGVGSSLNPSIYAEPVSVSSDLDGPIGAPLMALAALFLIAAVFGPPMVLRIRRKRRKS